MAGLLTGCQSENDAQATGESGATPTPGVPPQHLDKLQGLDVSHYQGVVQWESVKGAGISFGIAKATGGTQFVDPQFANNWHGMREAGVVRGAYHFFYADEDPITQAEHFLQAVPSLNANDLPPALDVEINDNVPSATLVARALIWMRHVEQKLGKKPMIYSDISFYKENLAAGFKDYALWVADYDTRIPQPEPGRSWEIWQYSQTGSVHGISGNVDLDLFNGDLDQLMTFVGGTSAPPAAEATPAPATPDSTPTTPTPTPTPATPAPTPTPAPTTGTQTYTVKPGDTMHALARRFGVSVSAIASANGIANPNILKAGEVLRIPTAQTPAQTPTQTPAQTPAQTQTYTVKSGDTMYRIALRFGVSINALASANGITDPSKIRAGQVLRIPN